MSSMPAISILEIILSPIQLAAKPTRAPIAAVFPALPTAVLNFSPAIKSLPALITKPAIAPPAGPAIIPPANVITATIIACLPGFSLPQAPYACTCLTRAAPIGLSSSLTFIS